MSDVWTDKVAQGDGEATVNVLLWLSRMTLDVIGQAGMWCT